VYEGGGWVGEKEKMREREGIYLWEKGEGGGGGGEERKKG